MKPEEVIQLKKNEALNKIRKIYHPKTKNHYSPYTYEEGSYTEQREGWISEIIETLEKEIREFKATQRLKKVTRNTKTI